MRKARLADCYIVFYKFICYYSKTTKYSAHLFGRDFHDESQNSGRGDGVSHRGTDVRGDHRHHPLQRPQLLAVVFFASCGVLRHLQDAKSSFFYYIPATKVPPKTEVLFKAKPRQSIWLSWSPRRRRQCGRLHG